MSSDRETQIGRAEGALARREPAVTLRLLEGLDADAVVWNLRGRAHNNLRQLEQAEAAFREAVDDAPSFGEAWHNLGHVRWMRGDLAGAREALGQGANHAPDDPRIWHKLGLISSEENHPEEAEQHLRRSLELADDPRVRTHLATVMHKAGRDAEAEAELRRALSLAPGDPGALTNLAVVLQADGRLDDAEAALEEALIVAHDDPRIWEDLAYLEMKRGDWEAAIAATDRCLQLVPGHAGAYSIRVPALYAAGRRDEAEALQDFEFLRESHLDQLLPDVTVTGLNAELREHVLAHPTLRHEPAGHATRNGAHTADLLQGHRGPMRELEEGIRAAVEAYSEQLPEDPAHPLNLRRPERWTLTAWSVVMDAQGHQLPHVHPAAWVSGVYYVQIPPVIAASDPQHAGWIAFGEPPDEFVLPGGHPVERIRPSEGRMFLFPSWFWHHTVPFAGDTQRICIAFDVLPAV